LAVRAKFGQEWHFHFKEVSLFKTSILFTFKYLVVKRLLLT